jgi:hypothetical protein
LYFPPHPNHQLSTYTQQQNMATTTNRIEKIVVLGGTGAQGSAVVRGIYLHLTAHIEEYVRF